MATAAVAVAATATATATDAIVELSHASGLDLPAYRADHVARRIQRAVELEGLSSVAELVRKVRADDAARDRFRSAIAVPVSSLMRERDELELLERRLLPAVAARRASLRVWSAGCADGAELYELALLLERDGRLEGSYLLGSDILVDRIAAALLGRCGKVEVPARVRARARFEHRDLLRDPLPPGLFDVVVCRHVATYLAEEARDRLCERLADALAPGGVLLLGHGERVSDPAALGLEPAGPHAYRLAA